MIFLTTNTMPNQDGDPVDGDTVTEEFEFGKDNKPSGEADQEATADNKADKPAENQADQGSENKQPDGQGSDDNKSQDNTGQEEGKKLSTREQQLHNQALTVIEGVLNWNNQDEARKFFEEHKDLAEIANKSKRLKDNYRELVEKKTEAPVDDTAKKTDADEDVLASRVMAKATEQSMRAERKTQAEAFAGKEGINADHFDNFLKAAESLRETTGLSFEQCLHGAKETLFKTNKQDSIEKPNKGSTNDTVQQGNTDKDAKISELMKKYNIPKQKAEKMYERGEKMDKGGWVEM